MPLAPHTNHNVTSNGVTQPRMTPIEVMKGAFKMSYNLGKGFLKAVTNRDELTREAREYSKSKK